MYGDKAFREVDTNGKPHWSSGKVIEVAITVIVTSMLSTLLTTQTLKVQVEQALKTNDLQDEKVIKLTSEVIELQRQMVGVSKDIAHSQRQVEEQQRQIVEMLKRR